MLEVEKLSLEVPYISHDSGWEEVLELEEAKKESIEYSNGDITVKQIPNVTTLRSRYPPRREVLRRVAAFLK